MTPQEIYDEAIRNDCAPKLAEMLACRKYPGTRTDDDWHRGQTHFSEEIGEEYASEVKTLVEAQGHHMGGSDDYIPALARYKGDPNAVIHGHGARGQIRKAMAVMAEHRREMNEGPRTPLAEDLIEEEIQNRAKDDPGVLQRHSKRELREMVIDKHAPKYD